MLKKQPYLLKNKIQHYAWGSKGSEAFITQLLGINPEPGKPYAELWMGVHSNAPSDIQIDHTILLLEQQIKQYPREMLGEYVAQTFSNSLPFLLKVLSAEEALSIQVHPSKEQAVILHQKNPTHYPDQNHKPEIAIALDSHLAIVGFKPFPDLLHSLNKYPEITSFIGENHYQNLKKAQSPPEQKKQLKIFYSVLMKKSITHQESLSSLINQLENRLSSISLALSIEERYFLDLKKKYQNDVGLFSIFLFNLVELKAGEGIFLKAGVPHAYLKGNIVECMANSDNVVRAGLTPKFKDIETLIEILSYDMEAVPIIGGDNTSKEIIYKTAASEFQITRRILDRDRETFARTNDKPAILLIIEGEILFQWYGDHRLHNEEDERSATTLSFSKIFRKGHSIFIPAFLDQYKIVAKESSLIFKAEVP